MNKEMRKRIKYLEEIMEMQGNMIKGIRVIESRITGGYNRSVWSDFDIIIRPVLKKGGAS
jgi:hypothetical protein